MVILIQSVHPDLRHGWALVVGGLVVGVVSLGPLVVVDSGA